MLYNQEIFVALFWKRYSTFCGVKEIIELFMKEYDENDSREQWFEKIQVIAERYGYAKNTKEYKCDPKKYKGNVSEIVNIFRFALTAKMQTPDLYLIMRVMGKACVFKRLLAVIVWGVNSVDGF